MHHLTRVLVDTDVMRAETLTESQDPLIKLVMERRKPSAKSDSA
jgi:hypothetical protein